MDLLVGIIAGIIAGFFMWLFTQLFNINARSTLRIQSKRMQYYLSSMKNDIVWGTEDADENYYYLLMSKVPFVLQAIDLTRSSISCCNFLFLRKAIIKQLDGIQSGMEDILLEVEAAEPRDERIKRLEAIANKYGTETSNVLLIRAEFLEALSNNHSVRAALDTICYDGDSEEIEHIFLK